MAKGGSSQTSTQTSQPWAAAQPYLKQGLNEANALFMRGGFAPPTTWSQEKADAMKGLSQAGYENMGGRGLSGQYQDVINRGGYNAAQQAAVGNTQNLANSSWSVSPELQK